MRELLLRCRQFANTSLKLRITVTFTLFLLATLIFFCTSAYLFQKHEFGEEIDSMLKDDLKLATKYVTADKSGDIQWIFKTESSQKRIADHWIEIWSHDERLLFRSSSFGDTVEPGILSAPEEERVRKALSGRKGYLIYPVYSPLTKIHYRMLLTKFSINDQSYLIRVVRSEENLHEEMSELLLTFLIFTPLMIFPSFLGGYLITKQFLKPFSDLADQAKMITANNLNQRLELDHYEDEFGELAQTFNNTLDRLENSFSRVESFASEASHSLRTPLTCLMNIGELALSDTGVTGAGRETIADMLEETRRLRTITETLLTLARIDNTDTFGEHENIDLRELVNEVTEELIVLCEEKSQTMTMKNTDTPLVVTGNTFILREALTAIVDNAIKYTPPHGSIRVEFLNDTEFGQVVICDNGPGIPQEKKEQVFEKFARGLSSKETPTGFGLGLSLAKSAIEACRGTIQLFDGYNEKGLRCVIRLPLAKEHKQ